MSACFSLCSYQFVFCVLVCLLAQDFLWSSLDAGPACQQDIVCHNLHLVTSSFSLNALLQVGFDSVTVCQALLPAEL